MIDENKASGLNLFRLAENKRLILISIKLKEYLEAQWFKGIYYQDTFDYDGKPANSFWED